MKKSPLLLLLTLLLTAPAVFSEVDPFEAMVAAERAFARLSVEEGIATAFSSFAEEGAVVFDPAPVDLATWIEKLPEPDSSLDWYPRSAGVAASGDLGWTSGPWTMVPAPGLEEIHGTYLTLWHRQPDNTWKWVIDIGVSHPLQEGDRDGTVVDVPTFGAAEASDQVQASRTRLFMADRLLGVTSEKHGRVRAYEDYGDPDLRLLRQGKAPIVGLDASLDLLGASQSVENWRTKGGGISRGADLGYTYGYLQTVENDGMTRTGSGYYLRVWRRSEDGDWKILLDVELPAAPS